MSTGKKMQRGNAVQKESRKKGSEFNAKKKKIIIIKIVRDDRAPVPTFQFSS